MRAVIQRSGVANCKVDETITGSIESGLVVFLGIGQEDGISEIEKLVQKIISLRLFKNEDKNFELSIKETSNQILLISQFTLYASCKKGRRPDFNYAAKPDHAKNLYAQFIRALQRENIDVETGVFGADMKISLVNEGPVTIFIDTKEL